MFVTPPPGQLTPEELGHKPLINVFPESLPTSTAGSGDNGISDQPTVMIKEGDNSEIGSNESTGKARKGKSTTITTANGETEVGNSAKASRTGGEAQAPMHPDMQDALEKVEDPSLFHGKCCEIDAMNKVLNKGGDLKGAKIDEVKDNKTGNVHDACSTCKDVKEQFDVE